MPMYQRTMFLLLFLILVGAGGAMYGYSTQDDAIPLDAAEQIPAAVSSASVTVYVTGAVNHPGIVEVPEEARVADAVNACGGALPTADMEGVNMAQKLKDGQQVRIPEKTEMTAPPRTAAAVTGQTDKTGEGGRININTADEKALDSLPGIGPAMAKRIIEYRNTEGMFQSPEDLKKIKGIGDAKYEKLKDRITV